MSPCVAYWYYYHQNSDEEHLHEKLRQDSHYARRIELAKQRRTDFNSVMKRVEGQIVDDSDFNEVFHAGKGQKKRHYAVDSNLYGTQEGADKRERYLDSQKKTIQEKKKKKKKKTDSVINMDASTSEGDAMLSGAAKAGVASVVVGSLAVAASFMLGGNRRS